MRRSQRRSLALVVFFVLFVLFHVFHHKSQKTPQSKKTDTRAVLNFLPSAPTSNGHEEILRHHFCELVQTEEAVKSMWNFARLTSLFRDLSLSEQDWKCNSTLGSSTDSFMQRLQSELFPWLKTSAKELQNSFQPGRVIVYTTARHHAHYVYLSIQALRYLHCKLPVMILYRDDLELPLSYRTALESLDNVKSMPINDLMNWDNAKPEGWAIKPFAMLFAPYQEILFIDSDVYFMRNPETLFDDPEYKETGALFFHDRSLFSNPDSPSHAWFKSYVPNPSAVGKGLRHWKTTSQHEQESGVVVINKGSDAFYGLLTACAMNAAPRRNEVFGKVYGDKETFWMGFEAAQVKYAFMPVFGSVIGFRAGDQVCGGLLHVDRSQRPLWFNNGVQVDKYSQPNRLIEISVFSLDTDGQVSWQFGDRSPNGFCMSGGKVRGLSAQDSLTGQWILNSYKKMKENTTFSTLWEGN